MNDIDRKIRDALRQEDAEVFADLGDEPSLFELAMESFRGKHRFFSFLAVFWGIVFMVISIYSAVQFFNVETTRDLLVWMAVFMFSISAVSMLKIWHWMEIQKNAVMREIKRVELQIAVLAKRIK